MKSIKSYKIIFFVILIVLIIFFLIFKTQKQNINFTIDFLDKEEKTINTKSLTSVNLFTIWLEPVIGLVVYPPPQTASIRLHVKIINTGTANLVVNINPIAKGGTSYLFSPSFKIINKDQSAVFDSQAIPIDSTLTEQSFDITINSLAEGINEPYSKTYSFKFIKKLGEGASCSNDNQCYGTNGLNGKCIHSACRTTSTYCGDNFCDTGENCPSDKASCGQDTKCSSFQCTDGCKKTSIIDDINPGQCDSSAGCSAPPCKCDSNGNCITTSTAHLIYQLLSLTMLGCPGNFKFAPDQTYSLTICIDGFSESCNTITTEEYGIGNSISPKDVKLLDGTYTLAISWTRIKDPSNQYDHGGYVSAGCKWKCHIEPYHCYSGEPPCSCDKYGAPIAGFQYIDSTEGCPNPRYGYSAQNDWIRAPEGFTVSSCTPASVSGCNAAPTFYVLQGGWPNSCNPTYKNDPVWSAYFSCTDGSVALPSNICTYPQGSITTNSFTISSASGSAPLSASGQANIQGTISWNRY